MSTLNVNVKLPDGGVLAMAVWTISAQEGTGGANVAAELAAAARVPFLDRRALTCVLHELEPMVALDDDLEARVGGRLNAFALSMAIPAASPDAMSELHLRKMLPALGRAVLTRAACSSCVIYAPGAFAVLADHAAAVHVRLRAPLDWRIANYQREELVDRRCAEKRLRNDDHRKQAWVKSLYRLDLENTRLFSLVLDASRFSPDRLVDTLLAAAGVAAAPVC
jgi:hypothetical protein